MTEYSEFAINQDEWEVVQDLLKEAPLAATPSARPPIRFERITRDEQTITGHTSALPRILLVRWFAPGDSDTPVWREELIYDGKRQSDAPTS